MNEFLVTILVILVMIITLAMIGVYRKTGKLGLYIIDAGKSNDVTKSTILQENSLNFTKKK